MGQWTFNDVPSFLQGIPSQLQVDFPGTGDARTLGNKVFAGYLQDDFRVLSNLTINIGVRYEMATVVSEKYGRISSFRNITDPAITVFSAAGCPNGVLASGSPCVVSNGSYYNNPTTKNFAPRFGFAWDPFKDGKTSIRGGASMFDIVPLAYLFQSRAPRSAPYFESAQKNATASAPLSPFFPNNILGAAGLTAFRASSIEANPAPAYRLQWNLNVQRQLTNSIALTVGYVGSAGVHLVRGYQDMNLVQPNFLTIAPDGHYALPNPIVPKAQSNYGTINGTYWDGHNSYDGMTVNLVQRPLKGLMYQVAYTWSKNIDNGSTTWLDSEYKNSASSPYPYLPRINRGPADYDVPQNFVANFLYEVPVGEAVRKHAVANTILGGWQFGGIYTLQSGTPFSLKVAKDQANTGSTVVTTAQGYQAPDYNPNAPGCNNSPITGNIGNYINTSCFFLPKPGEFGNEGRNDLRMPTFRDLDFSLFKNQNLMGEKLKMQLRFEVFNVMNNTNLQAVIRTIFNGSGALQTNVGTAQISAATLNSSRQMQVGIRFLF